MCLENQGIMASILLDALALMKTRILLSLAAVVIAVPQVLAVDPGTPVPDSGGTAGALALGLLALVALRRKLSK